jgi:hypothetical protein
MKYFGLMLAVFLSISYPAVLPAASNQDEARVCEVIANLMRAWNVHDMQAFSEQFTDDAGFVNSTAPGCGTLSKSKRATKSLTRPSSKRLMP